MIMIIGRLNVKEEMFQVLVISIQLRTVHLLKYLLEGWLQMPYILGLKP